MYDCNNMKEMVLVIGTDENSVYMDSATVATRLSYPKLDRSEWLPWANNHPTGTDNEGEARRPSH